MENKESKMEIENKSEEQIQAIKTSEFMKETIKKRPLNKKKLARKLAVTIIMAVVFGLVSCVTIIFLEPMIDKKLNPEVQVTEFPETVTFVEETIEEETKPEDMIVDEAELLPVVIDQGSYDDEQIEKVVDEMELDINDYVSLNDALVELSNSIMPSIVDVIKTTEDTDWFEDTYQSEDITAGAIIADNGLELLILADMDNIDFSDNLKVQFNDGNIYNASIKSTDRSTGLTIIGVKKSTLRVVTLDSAKIIQLGITFNQNLFAAPVIAIGRPLGSQRSVCIGNITSYQSDISVIDANYKAITTDIFGSTLASGIIINLKGQLIGVIDMSHNSDEFSNMISGYAISELKPLIERMSNDFDIPYIGMRCKDVSTEISEALGIPEGIYISSLEMDSPALDAGIKAGDIIVRLNDYEIKTYREFSKKVVGFEPGEEIRVEIMRQGLDGYTSMEFVIVLSGQSGVDSKEQ